MCACKHGAATELIQNAAKVDCRINEDRYTKRRLAFRQVNEDWLNKAGHVNKDWYANKEGVSTDNTDNEQWHVHISDLGDIGWDDKTVDKSSVNKF